MTEKISQFCYDCLNVTISNAQSLSGLVSDIKSLDNFNSAVMFVRNSKRAYEHALEAYNDNSDVVMMALLLVFHTAGFQELTRKLSSEAVHTDSLFWTRALAYSILLAEELHDPIRKSA